MFLPGFCVQEKSPFKPLAERVREFQFKTPPRFKSKPSKPASNNTKKSPITKAEVCIGADAPLVAVHT
jgi:hypothetical protein